MKNMPTTAMRRIAGIGKASGLTLIELVLAIVIIGISVPAIMIPLSGLSETKHPEYVVEASFLAQRQMEALAASNYTGVPAAGTYTCAVFRTGSTPDIDCSSTNYVFSWLVEDVTAADPDTNAGAPNFAKKITLTVTRADGAMTSLDFFTLFAL